MWQYRSEFEKLPHTVVHLELSMSHQALRGIESALSQQMYKWPISIITYHSHRYH